MAAVGQDLDPDGYQLLLNDTQVPETLFHGASPLRIEVAGGTHTIELRGNSINCDIHGANPRSVSVARGATVQVRFDIECIPAPAGSLLFSSVTQHGQPWRIVRVNADGTDTREIPLTLGTVDPVPTVAPDGSRIAFRVDGQLYTADVDEGDQALLADLRNEGTPFSIGGSLAWDPTGERLALTGPRGDHLDVFLLQSDGSGYRPAFAQPAPRAGPAWSPDATRLAYSTSVDPSHGALAIADIETQEYTLLTSNEHNAQPAWSRDGTRIVYLNQPEIGGPTRIRAIDIDGSNARSLTDGSDLVLYPTWSPHGDWVAFVRERDGGQAVWIMRADGSRETRITQPIAVVSNLSWY